MTTLELSNTLRAIGMRPEMYVSPTGLPPSILAYLREAALRLAKERTEVPTTLDDRKRAIAGLKRDEIAMLRPWSWPSSTCAVTTANDQGIRTQAQAHRTHRATTDRL